MFSCCFTSLSIIFFLYWPSFLSLYTVFDSVSSNIDEVLSINPSANVFVSWDFNAHHMDWLTYSGRTDRPGELCYNFSMSNDLTQMVSCLTQIPDCYCHSPALLELFLSSDPSICSAIAFILIILLSQFPLIYQQTQNGMPCFIAKLTTILVLIGMVFVVIWEMFHRRVGSCIYFFQLKLMYISLIVSIKSNLTHLLGFQLLVLVP